MGAKLTYQQAGVDTRRAAALVGDIKGHVARTQQNRKLLGAFGLFAACYDLSSYREPVIVTGCDGVGTKLELLLGHDLFETAGKDLVAMSVNDILTTGGDPLLFLDYIGIAALDEAKITRLIGGMCDYLADCDCILAGGETAEMPGIVPPDVIELSGFCIGCAEKPELVDPSTLAVGDVLVGYPSDSIHANGWSLVRRVLKEHPGCVDEEELLGFLKPTRLYHDVVRDIRAAGVKPKAFAHITGGGLPGNLNRVLPGELEAVLDPASWEWPRLFSELQRIGGVDTAEMRRVFNLGIGMAAVVPPDSVQPALDELHAAGHRAVVIGEIAPGGRGEVRFTD